MPGYRSQIRQSLHYFARPHEAILREPVRGPSAWRGEDLARDPSWREALSAADVSEIEQAISHARSVGTPSPSGGRACSVGTPSPSGGRAPNLQSRPGAHGPSRPTAALSKDDFPLPGLSPRIDRWRREIQHGRGFQVITGVPVERWSEEDAGLFFWCLGLHLGIPGAQNPQGDLLGHVRDTGARPDGSVRQYRTREDIDFHCDLADVVGLLSLQRSKSGGKSLIASSVHAYNEVLRRRPDLVDRLYQPFWLDTKGEGGVPYVGVVPCASFGGEVRTFWHVNYYQSVTRYDPAPIIDDRERALLDLYREILHAPGVALEMELAPGDIQLLSNHTVVHGRTAFEDHDEPERKRHLLRLWLSLPERRTVRREALTAKSYAGVLARLAAARVRTSLSR